MTAAPNGVLLVSLGTLAEAVLTPAIINTLAKVLKLCVEKLCIY